MSKRWIEVDDNLNPDLFKLACALLENDTSAAWPLIDCALENLQNPTQRITADYVTKLEDCLRKVRVLFLKGKKEFQPHNTDSPHSLNLQFDQVFAVNIDIYTLERYARSLGRFGLS